MRLEPLGDKVVIKRIATDESTNGGIVLPDAARERSMQGRVLSVGEGRLMSDGRRVVPQVSEGDRVMFRSFAGTDVKVGSDEMLIISEDDILAILD